MTSKYLDFKDYCKVFTIMKKSSLISDDYKENKVLKMELKVEVWM